MKLSKILFAFVLFLIMTNTIAAQPVLYANVRNDGKNNINFFNSYDYDESIKHFPIPKYTFAIFGYDLKYNNTVKEEDREKNLNDFKLNMHAVLQLISFNQQTGHYKMRLTLNHPWLDYTGHTDARLSMTGGEFFKSEVKLKLSDGSDPVFIIEGKYVEMHGESHLINSNANPFFIIDFLFSKFGKDIALKRLRDFPVVVVSD